MNVSAIIVTRGDVSLREPMEALPEEWEKLVWRNGSGLYRWEEDIAGENPTYQPFARNEIDYSVYGRYRAIEYASHGVIYVQDDDCVVSDPQKIVDGLVLQEVEHTVPGYGGSKRMWSFEIITNRVVCNMPHEFRHDFYTDHALVGFGAAFHRDLPWYAFSKFPHRPTNDPFFFRTCDIVFTGLTSRILVDVPKENLPWAESPGRMWKQPEHQAERARMRELMLAARKETS